jgi:flavorubredoxin
MENPVMFEPYTVTRNIYTLASYLPVPGYGILPANAFVIHAQQPVLVDTGLAALRTPFLEALRQVIDPREIQWIWLTHTDPDHIGNLEAVLSQAPQARVVTTFLGMGKMGLLQLPLDRVYLLNPGQVLDLGDRQLRAVTPPSYDAPETTGLFDPCSGALFSADCFGALLHKPAEAAQAINSAALQEGISLWATVDAPWLQQVDRSRFLTALKAVENLRPTTVLSSHLPAATGMTETLLGYLAAAMDETPFQGPDQAALEQLVSASIRSPAGNEIAPTAN